MNKKIKKEVEVCVDGVHFCFILGSRRLDPPSNTFSAGGEADNVWRGGRGLQAMVDPPLEKKRLYKAWIFERGWIFERQSEMAKRTAEMGEDVQEVVARWVFGCELVAVILLEERPEFVQEGAFSMHILRVEKMYACGGVGRVWRKEFQKWKKTQVERATEVMWTRAVEEAVDMCRRHRYHPARGVRRESWLTCWLWVEGKEVVQGRFVRVGTGQRHALKAQVVEGGVESGWWVKRTMREAWSSVWLGWDASDALDAWAAEQTAALGAWVRCRVD